MRCLPITEKMQPAGGQHRKYDVERERVMSSAKQNQAIGRLIVGAMSIDGSLDKGEREKVARALEKLSMAELLPYVGAAIDEVDGSFNMFQECKVLLETLGSDAVQVCPLIFRLVSEVIASDRFVSAQEAAYLSALAKRLNLPVVVAQQILKQVMAERRGRLEISGKSVDQGVHQNLKELLSFQGSDDLVGEVDPNSIDELIHSATSALSEGERVSMDEVERSLAILGLKSNAKLQDAEAVWRETLENLNLGKMAQLGETFVTAALNRITTINEAFKVIAKFHKAASTRKPTAG